MATKKGLTGKRKAAILLISMGTELSSLIFQHLSDAEIETLTLEIVNAGVIDAEIRNDVLTEFGQLHLAQEYIAFGGVEYAQELLEKALGEKRSIEIMERVLTLTRSSPLESVRDTAPEQLLSVIENEHPQTIALILSYLPPANAAVVLGSLPQDIQSDVAIRIALMEGTTPDVLREVGAALERKVHSFGAEEMTVTGGIKPLVDILNSVDRSTERAILDKLDAENPELAEEVRKSMFVFEDLAKLDDRSLGLLLREVDSKELGLALKIATEDVKQKFFKCMSERAAQMLREDMDFMGAVRLKAVEEAQQNIVTKVREMEESGAIQLSRGGQGEEFVS